MKNRELMTLETYSEFTQKQNEFLEFESSLQNEISKPSSENIDDGLYLFISFDIVNSTWMKSKDPERWPVINSEFYNSVKSCFSIDTYDKNVWKENSANFKELLNRGGGFRIWKLVGDEVVIYCKIVASEVLYEAILFADQAKDEILKKMKINKLLAESSLLETFALKTSIWIADCGEKYYLKEQENSNTNEIDSYENKTGKKRRYKNIIYDPSKLGITSGTPHMIDFLGPDMDEGFRLTRLSEKNKVLVSPKLVYTMYKYFETTGKRDGLETLERNFKILKYEKLKGVWDERPYPVIIFHHSFEKNYLNELEYDEILSSPLCSDIREYGFQQLCQNKLFSINRLEKIFKDMRLEEEINQIQEYLLDVDAGRVAIKKTRTLAERPIFQVACVCYDETNKAIFLEKDEDDCFSFGHHVPRSNSAMKEGLVEAYKQFYSVELDPTRINLDDVLSSYRVKTKGNEPNEYIFCIVVLGYVAKQKCKQDNVLLPTMEKKTDWYTIAEIEQMLNNNEQNQFIDHFADVIDKIKGVCN